MLNIDIGVVTIYVVSSVFFYITLFLLSGKKGLNERRMWALCPVIFGILISIDWRIYPNDDGTLLSAESVALFLIYGVIWGIATYIIHPTMSNQKMEVKERIAVSICLAVSFPILFSVIPIIEDHYGSTIICVLFIVIVVFAAIIGRSAPPKKMKPTIRRFSKMYKGIRYIREIHPIMIMNIRETKTVKYCVRKYVAIKESEMGAVDVPASEIRELFPL